MDRRGWHTTGRPFNRRSVTRRRGRRRRRRSSRSRFRTWTNQRRRLSIRVRVGKFRRKRRYLNTRNFRLRRSIRTYRISVPPLGHTDTPTGLIPKIAGHCQTPQIHGGPRTPRILSRSIFQRRTRTARASKARVNQLLTRNIRAIAHQRIALRRFRRDRGGLLHPPLVKLIGVPCEQRQPETRN